jgi:tetratricopeptide (TPR) repeat protein
MKGTWRLFTALFMALLGLTLAGCAQTLTFKAESQLARKNYDAAIIDYESYLQKYPADQHARGRLGVAYLGKKETAKAIDTFRKVLAQVPDEPQASLYLGLALLETGDRQGAMTLWRGYRNQQQPLVYQEVKRQLTLLEMVHGNALAKQALGSEQQLQTAKIESGTVAVTPYGDKPADAGLRPVQKALAAMVTTDLATIKALKVLERLRVQALIDEMKLGMSGLIEDKTTQRFGRMIGAEHLVTGTLAKMGEGLRASSVLASTIKKKMVGSFGVEGEMAKFFLFEKEIVAGIVKALNLNMGGVDKTVLERHHTKNLKAFLCFGQGLDALDSGSWKQAREYFECAVREDPQFLLAIEALESCPADTTPPLSTLLAQTPQQFAVSAQAAVETAITVQAAREAEKAATKAAENKGDGGGGGGRGGH